MAALALLHTLPSANEAAIAYDKIKAINLDPIIARLIKKDKWSMEKCKDVEQKYKGFLYLAYCNPNAQFVPSKEIDDMWHVHILHTKKYADDCKKALGFFLHHRPDDGSGMITDADRQFTAEAFASLGLDYTIPTECSGGTACSSCTM